MKFKVTRVIELIALATIILGAVSTMAVYYTRVNDIIEAAPHTEARVVILEQKQAISDDRWKRVEKWMERIDGKLDK